MSMPDRRAEPPPTDGPRHTAVVTGASSGIGQATAVALGGLGWGVAIGARRIEELGRMGSEHEPAWSGRNLYAELAARRVGR